MKEYINNKIKRLNQKIDEQTVLPDFLRRDHVIDKNKAIVKELEDINERMINVTAMKLLLDNVRSASKSMEMDDYEFLNGIELVLDVLNGTKKEKILTEEFTKIETYYREKKNESKS